MVKKYQAEILQVLHQGEGLYTVTFGSLNGKFRFLPGQFLHLALDNYDASSGWPDSRCFSMRSAPEEEKLQITYAVKGTFTQKMETCLKPGKKIWLKMPYGNLFTQYHNKKNTVFIAGGTGITPFLSLFTDHGFAQYQSPHLYAGFRNENMNLYEKELLKAKKINPSLRVTCFYQNRDDIIDINRIYEENNQQEDIDFFISGPPGMINIFRLVLLSKGLRADQIKTDDWE